MKWLDFEIKRSKVKGHSEISLRSHTDRLFAVGDHLVGSENYLL